MGSKASKASTALKPVERAAGRASRQLVEESPDPISALESMRTIDERFPVSKSPIHQKQPELVERMGDVDGSIKVESVKDKNVEQYEQMLLNPSMLDHKVKRLPAPGWSDPNSGALVMTHPPRPAEADWSDQLVITYNSDERGMLAQGALLEIFDQVKSDPDTWTPARIALEYNTDSALVEEVLRWCAKPVYVPVDGEAYGVYDVRHLDKMNTRPDWAYPRKNAKEDGDSTATTMQELTE